MANLRLFSIDMTGFGGFDAISKQYMAALASKDMVVADRIQRYIEGNTSRIFQANLVQGKLGQDIVTDFILSPSSPILKLFSEDIANRQMVEFKALASSFKGTKIGQLTLKTDKDYAIANQTDILSGQELAENVLKTNKTGYLVDIDPYFTKQSDGTPRNRSTKAVTARIFKYIRDEPKLGDLFYAKASTMVLNNIYSLSSQGKEHSGTRLVGLQFPREYFNASNFKVVIQDKALKLSINDSFQKKIFELLNKNYIENLKEKELKPSTASITVGGKKVTIDVLPTLQGTMVFGAQITKSIKVGPSDTFIGKGSYAIQSRQVASKDKAQSFITAAQWTALVQKRLGNSMSHFGKAAAPDLKYRTGKFFVDRISITPNYRANMLQYSYNPFLDSLISYGYRPDLQVERATREVAQQLYAREFNIVRKQS